MNFKKPLLEIVKATLLLPPRNNHLFAGKHFFKPQANSFVDRTPFFSVLASIGSGTQGQDKNKKRRPVEKCVVLQ